MFCVFHAGFDPVSPDVTRVFPQKALEIHKQFPRLKMVLAHMGGFARWDEVEELLVGTGVYFDTSLAPAPVSYTHLDVYKRQGATSAGKTAFFLYPFQPADAKSAPDGSAVISFSNRDAAGAN